MQSEETECREPGTQQADDARTDGQTDERVVARWAFVCREATEKQKQALTPAAAVGLPVCATAVQLTNLSILYPLVRFLKNLFQSLPASLLELSQELGVCLRVSLGVSSWGPATVPSLVRG